MWSSSSPLCLHAEGIVRPCPNCKLCVANVCSVWLRGGGWERGQQTWIAATARVGFTSAKVTCCALWLASPTQSNWEQKPVMRQLAMRSHVGENLVCPCGCKLRHTFTGTTAEFVHFNLYCINFITAVQPTQKLNSHLHPDVKLGTVSQSTKYYWNLWEKHCSILQQSYN